jgi:NAD(P)-dependent dehydrogenase (short-subunit alcohol dehydrogenase family)
MRSRAGRIGRSVAGSERAAHVAAELGPPTVLVNNAGFAHAADLADMTTEQWDADITVNLRGAFFAAGRSAGT